MKKSTRLVALLLSIVMLLSLLPMSALAADASGLGNFKKVNVYTDTAFADVSPADWFYENVRSAYEYGLMVGKSSSRFDTNGNMTVAETLTIAARLHSTYYTGKADFTQSSPWYQVYADYCKTNGIADPANYDLNASATRAQFAVIFSNALPDAALAEINAIRDNAIPDVKVADSYGAAVYRLYRAGILTGNDQYGTFAPSGSIRRSECAAITTRIVEPALRQSVRLTEQTPSLPEKTSGGRYYPPAPTPVPTPVPAGYYTVTFDSNGGTPVESQTVAAGECATEPAAPTREDHTFGGWYTDAALTVAYDFAAPVTKNIVLYAKWNEAVYYDLEFLDFYADEPDILVGESKTVSFFADIRSEQIVDTNDILLCNENGQVLAQMHDDGENGDEIKSDGVYSAKIDLQSTVQKVINYHAEFYNIKSTDFPVSYYLELTQDQLSAGDLIMDQLNQIAADYVETGDTETDYNHALESYNRILTRLQELQAQGDVKSFEHGSGDIYYTTPYNIKYCFPIECLLSKSWQTDNSTVSSVMLPDNSSLNSQSILVDSSYDQIRSKICVLKPFNWQHANQNLDNSATRILNTGLPYSYNAPYENQSVTVELFKKLQDYHVILLDAHGNVNHVCTGEISTVESKTAYSMDLQAERILIGTVSGDEHNNKFYCVSNRFFKTYYRAGELNNSLIYLGTCHGADSEELSSALMNAGAQTVLAYKNSVYTTYCEEMCEEVIKNMCKKDANNIYTDVSTAIDEAKEALGDTDGGYGNWLRDFFEGRNAATLEMFGNRNFKLSSGFVSGRVIDAVTGAPVLFGQIDTQMVCLAARVRNGAFSAMINTGTNDIIISSNGYLSRIIENVTVSQATTTYLSDSRLIPVGAENTTISGKIESATSAESIGNATLQFRTNHHNTTGEVIWSATADASGNFEINSLPVGYYTMEVSSDGYITQYVDILVGTNDNISVSLSPRMVGEYYRIVLTWGSTPSDLDSHLNGIKSNGSREHVFYSSKVGTTSNLDRDDTTSYGPETITVTDFDGLSNGFVYSVHDYTNRASTNNTALSASSAVVNVYQGSTLLKTYYVPTSMIGTVWNVFSIDEYGNITDINTFETIESPGDVGAGLLPMNSLNDIMSSILEDSTVYEKE